MELYKSEKGSLEEIKNVRDVLLLFKMLFNYDSSGKIVFTENLTMASKMSELS